MTECCGTCLTRGHTLSTEVDNTQCSSDKVYSNMLLNNTLSTQLERMTRGLEWKAIQNTVNGTHTHHT